MKFYYIMFMTTLKFKPTFDRMIKEDKLYDAYFCEKKDMVGSGRRNG